LRATFGCHNPTKSRLQNGNCWWGPSFEARQFRSQERNRHDAVNRLIELIRKAAKK